MRVLGRRIRDREVVEVDNFDQLIFVNDDGTEIEVSLYRARVEGVVEVRTNDGLLRVLPRAANLIHVERFR